MDQVYKTAFVATHDTPSRCEEAVVEHAAFGAPHAGSVLGLTLKLRTQTGPVLAIYTDVAEIMALLAALGVERPEELNGARVAAHFSARKLVGISA